MTVTDLHPKQSEADPTAEPAPAESAAAIELVLVAPGTLVLDANVRLDPRLDKQFVDSIRDLGVLVPIVAHRTDDGLHVLYGQRRTLAAVQTGRPQIPVYVVEHPDEEKAREVARIVGQIAENDHRTGLSGSERSGAFQQLTVLGLTATQVARKTHHKVKEVRAGLKVAGSTEAAAALDRYELTLPQAAALAEFDDDPDAVAELAGVAERDPGQFDHAVSRLRDRRAEDAVRAQVVAQLADAGVRLLERVPYGDPSIVKLEVLQSADGVELDAASHVGCAGHAAYVRDNGSWNGKIDICAVYVCTDWRQQGHRHRAGSAISGLDTTSTGGGAMSEKAKTERRVVIANNKAWGAAQSVRRTWLTGFLARRSAPKDAPQWIAVTLASSTHDVRRAMEGHHGLTLTLLGLGGDQEWSPYSGTPHPVVTAAATASPARATMLTLGLLLGGLEDGVTRDTWRYPTAGQRAYFTALRDWGYELSEVEQLVLGPEDADEPETADVGDQPVSDETPAAEDQSA